MKENHPASQCRQPIPQIIMLFDVEQFVSQNILELLAFEVREQFQGQQDMTAPPVTGGRRA